METTQSNLKKITSWLLRDNLELHKYWWHRFFKVLFVISIVSLAIYLATMLINSYENIVNRWNYVESLSKRLSEPTHTGQVFSVKQLYGDNEVITDKEMYSDDYHPSLESKRYLFPFSAMFLEDYDSENFCADDLSKKIQNIADTNNIKLFSPVNPTFRTLFADMSTFTDYLKNNSFSIKCVMINSYSIENDNGSTSKFTFLEPINTYEYNIYKYENGFGSFVLAILLSLVGLFMYALATIIIYYKIILYIVFGNKK